MVNVIDAVVLNPAVPDLIACAIWGAFMAAVGVYVGYRIAKLKQ
jgi:hypothetical protein